MREKLRHEIDTGSGNLANSDRGHRSLGRDRDCEDHPASSGAIPNDCARHGSGRSSSKSGSEVETIPIQRWASIRQPSPYHGSKSLDAEHWVGGISGVAHSGVSKTHTRLGGQPVKAGEDDI